MKNEKLTVWNGHGLERITREEFTERALNTPYRSPNYLDYEFFDLTGHILLWEYMRTYLDCVDSLYYIFSNKAKGLCFIDDDEYRRKVQGNASCFACVHALRQKAEEKEDMCQYCPFEWGFRSCISGHTLYERFKWADSVEEARDLALQIRDLPAKQGVIVR